MMANISSLRASMPSMRPTGSGKSGEADDMRPKGSKSRRRVEKPLVARNSKGGILVRRSDVAQAWQFLCNSREPMNRLDRADSARDAPKELKVCSVRNAMRPFFPKLTLQETRWILDEAGEGTVSADQLWALVRDNASDADPVEEAFRLVQGEDGHLDLGKVQQMCSDMGMPYVSEALMHRVSGRLFEEATRGEPRRGERGMIDLDLFRKLCPIGDPHARGEEADGGEVNLRPSGL